jgi:FlaA1/EpsC-like NDP-sugar epimerase
MTQSLTARDPRLGTGLVDELASLATGRSTSFFARDIEKARAQLSQKIKGRRILVIGGAGSIGASTVRAIIPFAPACLHVVDQSENGLAELIRDLRCRFDASALPELRAVPLNFGSPIMERMLIHEPAYDYILNFAALKHVRSEKDAFSILQMVDTNVIKAMHLLRAALERQNLLGYFSVSTDKAANPVNLMGASKRLMEHAIFSIDRPAGSKCSISSARFANVAFSDGSLLQGWLNRLAKSQPLAVPRETRRYFVSLEEAGQICLLAAFMAPDNHIMVPRLDPSKDLVDLSQIAAKVLNYFGYTPEYFDDEIAARRAATARKENRYPLLLTPLDTSGEKAYEEFVGEGEKVVEAGLDQLEAVPYVPAGPGLFNELARNMERLIDNPREQVSLPQLVSAIQGVLPEFHHHASSKNLDQRV